MGAILDADARRRNVADDGAVFLDVHAAAGVHVANDFAVGDDFSGVNLRSELRGRAGPLTMQSICTSSEPVTWPLIWMLAPRRAAPRAGAPPRRAEEGALNGTTGATEAEAGEAAGGSATVCCLDHIMPPLSELQEWKLLRVGGSSVEPM